jgi:polyphenol oxidase
MADLEWIIAADWPAPPGVRALTTTRLGPGHSAGAFARFNLGDACGDDPQVVAGNRTHLVEHLGLPSAPRWLRQVHGCGLVRMPDTLSPEPPEADAAITSVSGTVLAVLSADCLPVLLCAEDGSEVAAAHAGWRGLAAGVLEATVDAMRAPSDRLLAWLGPAIGPERYEVGAEVRDAFLAHDPEACAAFSATRPGHWHCDLYALARQRLAAIGVSRIHGGGLCTHSDAARFYSFRRDGRCGRMASLVWMTG